MTIDEQNTQLNDRLQRENGNRAKQSDLNRQLTEDVTHYIQSRTMNTNEPSATQILGIVTARTHLPKYHPCTDYTLDIAYRVFCNLYPNKCQT